MKIVAKNSEIGTSYEDIISNGGVLEIPTQARIHSLVSDSALDTILGTGVQIIEVQGVTREGFFETELVKLNGVTPVNMLNKYSWLQLKVIKAGTGGKNAGTILATALIDNTVTCRIEIEQNISKQAVYMMPYQYAGIISFFKASAVNETAGAITTIDILVKEHGEVWVPGFRVNLSSTNTEFEDKKTGLLPKLKPLSMMKVCAVASEGTSIVEVNFDIEQQ